MTSNLLAQPVFVVNADNSGVQPTEYSRFKGVFVVNAPSSGTAVDTYTKLELDSKLQSIFTRMDAMAEAQAKGSASVSTFTTSWIDQNVFLLKDKMKKYDDSVKEIMSVIQELANDYQDFRSYVLELLNVRECEKEMEEDIQPEKKSKTEEVTPPIVDLNAIELENPMQQEAYDLWKQ